MNIQVVLEALAAGDAMGAPTEFMTRAEIKRRFGRVKELLRPEQSLTHANLPYASVTDDTEQNLYLLREYLEKGRVDVT